MGEVTRTYRLHVPLNYNLNNEAPVPLLMDYHGWAGNAYWQERSSFFTGLFFVFSCPFLDSGFFMKHLPPSSLKIALGSHQIFSRVKVHHCYQRNRGKFSTGVNDTSAKKWVQYQTAATWKRIWRKNWFLWYFYYPKVSKQIIKLFWFEDIFHLPQVLMTPVVHLELRISPQISR